MNLEHVTIFLDRPRTAAAVYVALSTFQYDKDYLIGGWVEREHFVPAYFTAKMLNE